MGRGYKMFFAYVLENADGVEYRSNKPLFEVINEFKVKDDQIYIDNNYNKPELKRMIQVIKPEDTLLIRSVEDVADNMNDLLIILKKLSGKKITLYSCSEPFLCGDDYLEYINGYIKLHSYYNRKKKTDGYKKAVAEGRVGRPPKDKNIEKAIELYHSESMTLAEIKQVTGVSKSTLYRYLKKD